MEKHAPPFAPPTAPSAPPLDYDDDDLPIAIVAVATPVPTSSVMDLEAAASPSSSGEGGAPQKQTTTIDRMTNPTDGALSITISSTTHYPDGQRKVEIEYYHIPPDMTREVSDSLERGQMPSSTYMVRMEQQTLPPGSTSDIVTHPPPSTIAVSRTILPPAVNDNSVSRRGCGRRTCSVRWCIVGSLLSGILIVVVIVLVGVFVIQPLYFPQSTDSDSSYVTFPPTFSSQPTPAVTYLLSLQDSNSYATNNGYDDIIHSMASHPSSSPPSLVTYLLSWLVINHCLN